MRLRTLDKVALFSVMREIAPLLTEIIQTIRTLILENYISPCGSARRTQLINHGVTCNHVPLHFVDLSVLAVLKLYPGCRPLVSKQHIHTHLQLILVPWLLPAPFSLRLS